MEIHKKFLFCVIKPNQMCLCTKHKKYHILHFREHKSSLFLYVLEIVIGDILEIIQEGRMIC